MDNQNAAKGLYSAAKFHALVERNEDHYVDYLNGLASIKIGDYRYYFKLEADGDWNCYRIV